MVIRSYLLHSLFFSLLVITYPTSIQSQSVGIGTTSPNPSAALDVSSNNAGLLAPRIALTSLNDLSTIPNPATGLLIYNTATNGVAPNNVVPGYYFFNGTTWSRLNLSGSAPGEMLYWNGQQWLPVLPGTYGQYLAFCDGIPRWGGCLPLVTTKPISNITATTAVSGGIISNDGGNPISAKGIVWGTSSSPTIVLPTKTNNGADTASFVSNLVSLSKNTTYYVRAYAISKAGTAYGNELSFTTANYDITTGLLAYYPFTGNSGDSSGNANHGNSVGAITYVNDRNGKIGSAAQFGGGQVVTNADFFKFQYSQSYSISVWFTLENSGSSFRLMSTECPEGNFRISTYGNGQFAVQYGDAPNYIYETVSLNSWNHLVYTYDNRQANLYLNGVLKTSVTNQSTETLNYCNPFTIGSKAGTSNDRWIGKVDDLRIYNRVLTANDVLALFNLN